MKRGVLVSLLLWSGLPWSGAGASPAGDLLRQGEYARAYSAAQASGDSLTASRAAAAVAEYRRGGRDWVDRAVASAQAAAAASPSNPDAQLALGSALGLQARAGGYTLGALRTAHGARAALEQALTLAPARADVKVVLAEWHAGAWAKAGIFSGGNAGQARTLALAAAQAAPENVFVQTHAGLSLALLRDPQAGRILAQAAALAPTDALDRDVQALAQQTLATLK
ncbi:hypothetical protein GO986_16945 [Deinococcus sp. HMF7620]|uniref:Uncharacterized protein n=1 Tax=Deinococcus arboris TaxID=2682977 RepID=A0A7C9I4T5_9DEIO|nr:hypothetical protein [Deinococcus arboris]MVN88431.1 hypothetical protein [Deinococcus arboris]